MLDGFRSGLTQASFRVLCLILSLTVHSARRTRSFNVPRCFALSHRFISVPDPHVHPRTANINLEHSLNIAPAPLATLRGLR